MEEWFADLKAKFKQYQRLGLSTRDIEMGPFVFTYNNTRHAHLTFREFATEQLREQLKRKLTK